MTSWVKETKRPLVPQLPEEDQALIGKIESLLNLPSWNEAQNEEANRLSDEANGRREAWSTVSKGLSKKGGARNIAFTKGGIFADLRQELDARIEARKKAFAALAPPKEEAPVVTSASAIDPNPDLPGRDDPRTKTADPPSGDSEAHAEEIRHFSEPPAPAEARAEARASDSATADGTVDPLTEPTTAEQARKQELWAKPTAAWTREDRDDAYLLSNDPRDPEAEALRGLWRNAMRLQSVREAAEEARAQELYDLPDDAWTPAHTAEVEALCDDGNGAVRNGRVPLLVKSQRLTALANPKFDRPSDVPPTPAEDGERDMTDGSLGGSTPPNNDDGSSSSAPLKTLAFGTAVPTPGVPDGAPPPADNPYAPTAPTAEELHKRDLLVSKPINDWGFPDLIEASALTYGVGNTTQPRPGMEELVTRLQQVRTRLRTVLADLDRTPEFNANWVAGAQYLLGTLDPAKINPMGSSDFSKIALWRRWIAEILLRKSDWTDAETEWVRTHRNDLHPKLREALARTPHPGTNEKAGDANRQPLAQRTTEPPPPPMPARPPARTETVAPPRRRPDKAAPTPTVEAPKQKGSRWPLYLAAALFVFAIGVLGSIIFFTIPPATTGPTRTAQVPQPPRQPPTPTRPGPNAIRPGPTQPVPPVASQAPSRPLRPHDLNVRNLERVRPEQINALPYTILFGRIDCGDRPPSRNADGTLNYGHCRWREDPPAPRPTPSPTKTLAPTQRASTGPDLMA